MILLLLLINLFILYTTREPQELVEVRRSIVFLENTFVTQEMKSLKCLFVLHR